MKLEVCYRLLVWFVRNLLEIVKEALGYVRPRLVESRGLVSVNL